MSTYRILFIQLALLGSLSCSGSMPTPAMIIGTDPLTVDDVTQLVAQAVDVSASMNEKIVVAVLDREGNLLGRFQMTGAIIAQPATQPVLGEIAKARTAAYLSSNQHAFTPLTACFITRSHFPPTASNTPAGPLFGVPVSQLAISDVQPNGAPIPPLGPPAGPAFPVALGLTSISGGVPIYKSGKLAGGLGISGGSNTVLGIPGGPGPALLNQMLNYCQGNSQDEVIALTAAIGYLPAPQIIGSNINLDGIQLLYNNATGISNYRFRLTADSLVNYGTWLTSPRSAPAPRLPDTGYIYPIRSGQILTANDVNTIMANAIAVAGRTRAGIRQPSGSRAQVFIAVSDIDGAILALYRTPDATIFSLDVSVQKARSAVAFSDPTDPLGTSISIVLRDKSTVGQPLAVTTRAAGFLAQRYFPPGIDQGALPGQPSLSYGPLYIGTDWQNDFVFQITNSIRQPILNGVQIFPGGIPLYKNGQLAGGIGVSGDGVDQDDYIAAAGSKGFDAPPEIRSDRFFYKGVRMPWVKFPRNPEAP